MFRPVLLFFLLLSINVPAQEKVGGFGALTLNETSIGELKDIIYGDAKHNYGDDYSSLEENIGDTNLVDVNGYYSEFGICVKLSFFHDTLYMIEVEEGNCFLDKPDEKKDNGNFYEAFVMKYGGGKLSVAGKNVQCRCMYCSKPTTYHDYDSIRVWQNGPISAKMELKLVHFYADGGCQSPYYRSLEIKNLATIERTKKYLKVKEANERDAHNKKTKEMYKKL